MTYALFQLSFPILKSTSITPRIEKNLDFFFSSFNIFVCLLSEANREGKVFWSFFRRSLNL